MPENNNLFKYLLLYGFLLIYSLAMVFEKKTAQYPLFSNQFIVSFSIQFFFLVLYALLWQQVLKRNTLSFAYLNKGAVFVFTTLWAVLFFHEYITISNIIGSVIIVLGIWMIVKDE